MQVKANKSAIFERVIKADFIDLIICMGWVVCFSPYHTGNKVFTVSTILICKPIQFSKLEWQRIIGLFCHAFHVTTQLIFILMSYLIFKM